jgi:hypothetical protein
MFTINSSKNPRLRVATSAPQGNPQQPVSIGANSSKLSREAYGIVSDGFKSTSGTMPTGLGPNTNISTNGFGVDIDPMLQGIMPELDGPTQYRLYQDIYYHDPVAGTAVDLISNIFGGEFSLGGITTSNTKVNTVYQEAMERLSTKTLIPEISTDYLVMGTHCSSLLYNSSSNTFVDVLCHEAQNLTVTEVPFYSQDPIVTVKFSQKVKNFLNLNSEAANQIKATVGAQIMDKLSKGALELDPITTVYVARKAFTTSDLGISYYKRILPLYLIEKTLYRGTLVESGRRQRGILHITVGDGDEWIPQLADLEFASELFMNADADPLGAIVATRSGIDLNEVRQGGDFWKVTDFADSVLAYKLRALAISEAFLSGDATYNTADASLSIFVEMLRGYRTLLTRKIFYDRLFPLISLTNGFTVTPKGQFRQQDVNLNSLTLNAIYKSLNDGSKLLIPTVVWAKQLKPEGDSQYLEMLRGMTELGVPVPLRVLAAAGGFNLDDLLKQQDDDLEVRKKVLAYLKAIDDFNPKKGEEGGGDEQFSESSVHLASLHGGSTTLRPSDGLRVPLPSRTFNSELMSKSKTGKARPTSFSYQKRENERIDRLLAKSAARRNIKLSTKKNPII